MSSSPAPAPVSGFVYAFQSAVVDANAVPVTVAYVEGADVGTVLKGLARHGVANIPNLDQFRCTRDPEALGSLCFTLPCGAGEDVVAVRRDVFDLLMKASFGRVAHAASPRVQSLTVAIDGALYDALTNAYSLRLFKDLPFTIDNLRRVLDECAPPRGQGVAESATSDQLSQHTGGSASLGADTTASGVTADLFLAGNEATDPIPGKPPGESCGNAGGATLEAVASDRVMSAPPSGEGLTATFAIGGAGSDAVVPPFPGSGSDADAAPAHCSSTPAENASPFKVTADATVANAFDALSHGSQYRALIAACGVCVPVAEFHAADEDLVAHYRADWLAKRDIELVLGEGPWRGWQPHFVPAIWPQAEAYFAGVEYHLAEKAMPEAWVQHQLCLLRQAAFPLSATGAIASDGTYAGPRPPHAQQLVRVAENVAQLTAGTAEAVCQRFVVECGGGLGGLMFHATTHTCAAAILERGINISLGKPFSDFGRGFYLNPNLNDAVEWAFKTCSAEPALMVYQPVPAGDHHLVLDTSSNPSWQRVVDRFRRFGNLVGSDRARYGGHQTVEGLQATPRADAWVPRGTAWQFVVRNDDIAELWDAHLVGVMFLASSGTPLPPTARSSVIATAPSWASTADFPPLSGK